jgi:hypothetical protein
MKYSSILEANGVMLVTNETTDVTDTVQSYKEYIDKI